MKLQVTYKSPDALDYAVEDAVRDLDLTGDEKEEKSEELRNLLLEVLGSSEYLTVVVDTETKTATIRGRRK